MENDELIEFGMLVDDLSDVLLEHGKRLHWTKLVGALMNSASLICQDPELLCTAYLKGVDPKNTIFKKYGYNRATRRRKPALYAVGSGYIG